MSGEEFDEATSPEAICRLGSPARKHAAQRTGGPRDVEKETLS
jgi:hypothetical protein